MADRSLRLRLGDEFCVRHRGEHGLRALLGAFGIAVRRQPRRRLDEAREHRGFRHRDVLRGLAEISLRGGLDAVGAGAEIDAVEIEFENLGLGMLALQPQREFDLLQLALHGALLGQEQVFRQLLRQRRAALADAAMHDVRHRRARNAERVDAVMRIEAAILDGDKGLRQIGRQVFQRNVAAGHFAARRQHAAVEAGDLDGRRTLRNFQRLDRGQMRADPDHDADHRDPRPQAEHRAPIEQPIDERRARGPLDLRLLLPRLSRGFRSRGASLSGADGLRFAVWLFGLSSAIVTRSCGPRRSSANDAAKPEHRLPASAALFPCPRHAQRPATRCGSLSERGLKAR